MTQVERWEGMAEESEAAVDALAKKTAELQGRELGPRAAEAAACAQLQREHVALTPAELVETVCFLCSALIAGIFAYTVPRVFLLE